MVLLLTSDMFHIEKQNLDLFNEKQSAGKIYFKNEMLKL